MGQLFYPGYIIRNIKVMNGIIKGDLQICLQLQCWLGIFSKILAD